MTDTEIKKFAVAMWELKTDPDRDEDGQDSVSDWEDTIRAALRRSNKTAKDHAESEKLIDQIARTALMRGFNVEEGARGMSYFWISMRRPLPNTLGEAYFQAEVWDIDHKGVVLITQTDTSGNIKRSREAICIKNAKKFMAECLGEDWS